MPKKARQEILRLAKESNCDYLIIGSHPIFIDHKKLKEETKRGRLNSGKKTKLLIGIGLQSSDDEVRKVCVRTSVSKEMFLKAHNIIHEFEHSTKSYILLKPPFLTQQEAIEDTVASSVWLHENGVEDITICPLRIANGTVAKDLFEKKLFTQPKLARWCNIFSVNFLNWLRFELGM